MTKEQLGELVIDSRDKMYAAARSILGSDDECMDAVQEAIVSAFANLGQLKKDEYARTWLIRIVIRTCYDMIRKRKSWIEIEECDPNIMAVKWEYKNYGDLYHAVRQLPEELRLAVVLYYVEELSCREIAQILEITEGAVQKRLARARRKLRISLREMEVMV